MRSEPASGGRCGGGRAAGRLRLLRNSVGMGRTVHGNRADNQVPRSSERCTSSENSGRSASAPHRRERAVPHLDRMWHRNEFAASHGEVSPTAGDAAGLDTAGLTGCAGVRTRDRARRSGQAFRPARDRTRAPHSGRRTRTSSTSRNVLSSRDRHSERNRDRSLDRAPRGRWSAARSPR